MLDEDDAYDAMMEWWPKRPNFSMNEHGLWCLQCGDCVAPAHWFEREGFQPRETCKECGSDGVGDDD